MRSSKVRMREPLSAVQTLLQVIQLLLFPKKDRENCAPIEKESAYQKISFKTRIKRSGRRGKTAWAHLSNDMGIPRRAYAHTKIFSFQRLFKERGISLPTNDATIRMRKTEATINMGAPHPKERKIRVLATGG